MIFRLSFVGQVRMDQIEKGEGVFKDSIFVIALVWCNRNLEVYRQTFFFFNYVIDVSCEFEWFVLSL